MERNEAVKEYRAAKGKSVWGIRVKNAGIGLTPGEMELMQKECDSIQDMLGHRFSKTALVRYWGRQYFGEEAWEQARTSPVNGTAVARNRQEKDYDGQNDQEGTSASGETDAPQ